MTDDEVDSVVVPQLLNLVQVLVSAGRSPERSFADLRLGINVLEDARAAELAQAAAEGKPIP